MTQTSVLLDVAGVSRSRHDHGITTHLLATTSFVVQPGELVVLAGPSGSGKTTLCNLVLGWDHPDTGTIAWDPSTSDRSGWSRNSAAPQRLALLDHLSVRENLLLPIWASPTTTTSRFDELVEQLDITHLLGRRPDELSLGEQQRVAVARALVTTPLLAVLDEPTGHQDEVHADAVIHALLAARSASSSVLTASHDGDLIAAADRVVELRPPLH